MSIMTYELLWQYLSVSYSHFLLQYILLLYLLWHSLDISYYKYMDLSYTI